MKQHKTKRKRLLVLALCLLTALSMLPVTAMAGADANSAAEGQVTITKTLVSSTPDDDGNYTIKLTVQGNPVTQNVQPNADVVLVVDCSGSMDETFLGINSRMKAAKKAGKTFADKILTTRSGNKMAVIGFSSEDEKLTLLGWVTYPAVRYKTDLVSDKNTIHTTIDSMLADGGTDYTAALTEAKRILDNRSNPTRPGYVVFISDGAPGPKGKSHDDPEWNGSVQVGQLKTAGIKIYTVGIELKESEARYLRSMATDDKHYINISKNSVGKDLEGILTEWAETINSVPAGTNAVMTDVINDECFEYVSSDEGLTYNDETKLLTWNIGDIPEQEQSVTFKIKPKEGWSGTQDTNKSCKLTYTKPDTTPDEATAPSPQITLTATTGTVTINKSVTDLPNEKLPDEFTFKIMQGEIEKATVTATKNENGGYNAATANDLAYGSYTVVEEGADVEGYEVTTTGLAGTIMLSKETPTATVNVTNTYKAQGPPSPEVVTVTIKKIVSGSLPNEKWPESFTFDIKQDDEIKATVTVKKNNKGTYDDATRSLEVGRYTVVEYEQNVSGYHVNTSSNPANGELDLTKEGATITFTNSYEMIPPDTGTLIVKKTVSGGGADYNKAFTFKVELEMSRPEAKADALMSDMPNNGDLSGDEPGDLPLKIDDVIFKGNSDGVFVGTFTLRHNESKTLPIPTSDYPAGVPYTITEIDHDGYTVTVNGQAKTSATGVIEEKETTVVTFNNHKDGGYTPGPTYYPLTIQKVVTGLESVPADYKATVNVMSKYSSVPTRTLMLEPNKPQTVHLPYGEYTLTETAPAVDGYKLTGQTFSETTFMLTYGGKNVTITNAYTKEQEKPVVIPDDPMVPEDDKPDKPSKAKDDTSKVPKTGDDTPLSLALYGLIAAGALLGIRKAAKRKIK